MRFHFESKILRQVIFASILLSVIHGGKNGLLEKVFDAVSTAAYAGTGQTDAVTTSNSDQDYAKTKYPIILVHGLLGTDKILGVVDYWYGIADDLQAHGATVYTVNLTNFQKEEGPNGRGEQLLKYIKQVLVVTGAKKVNLIGHSQGGITSRYVASVAPDLVASVTTIASPHLGTEFADFVVSVSQSDPTGVLGGVLNSLQNLLGFIINSAHYTNQDAAGAWKEVSVDGMADFNKNFPTSGINQNAACSTGAAQETINGNVHLLYSWTGAAIVSKQGVLGTYVTDTSTTLFDPAYLDFATGLMEATGQIMANRGVTVGDGLVSVCRAKFGRVIGDKFNWNHTDEVNQMFGILGAKAENPVMVIRTHANRLKQAGV